MYLVVGGDKWETLARGADPISHALANVTGSPAALLQPQQPQQGALPECGTAAPNPLTGKKRGRSVVQALQPPAPAVQQPAGQGQAGATAEPSLKLRLRLHKQLTPSPPAATAPQPAVAAPAPEGQGQAGAPGGAPPLKRGRGRPRKVVLPISEQQVAALPTPVVTLPVKGQVGGPEGAPPPKRGRGRPRKTAPVSELPAVPSALPAVPNPGPTPSAQPAPSQPAAPAQPSQLTQPAQQPQPMLGVQGSSELQGETLQGASQAAPSPSGRRRDSPQLSKRNFSCGERAVMFSKLLESAQSMK